MSTSTIIGLLAGLTTTFAFLPQIIKTIRTKDTKSISLPMYIIYVIGVLTWFVYAILIDEMAIVISNCFSFLFGITMLIMKIRYK
jgi:MtN3 and saliva related transmembrane protein